MKAGLVVTAALFICVAFLRPALAAAELRLTKSNIPRNFVRGIAYV